MVLSTRGASGEFVDPTGLSTVETCYKTGDDSSTQRCFKTLRSTYHSKSWQGASDWCGNQTGGYTLATVRDEATQRALLSFLEDNELTVRSVWIGARQTVNSRWKWLNGSSATAREFCRSNCYH